MISRMYTVESEGQSKEYKGFNRAFTPGSEVGLVAVILREGEPDVYCLDEGKQPIAEFVRYMTDDAEIRGVDPQLLGIYKRVG